ncbi:MEMBRANE-ASSOCIATED PROTEIN HEM [Salix koriyanagi]|uniref:MEMBRANE-ASSOCIATED PROTEIN HEM n=1 Tax=Salix koriyanagi TaxID=2511006 RepID=A0A9Q0PI17_9ROSI|nr:MEMBRANE-ASSOCIATED PROTEIN HEM [Salix koriyanagi]
MVGLSEHHVWTRRGDPSTCYFQKDVLSIAVHGLVVLVASPIVPEEVMKIGRDAILYVESLIESIIGGLEGLINILDSEGGFGALETQLLPEQAALYLNESSRVSIPASKSLKGAVGFPLPGHESYPENNSAIKMYGL